MKKVFLVLFAAFSVMNVTAVQPKEVKIYINPGHGGYDSDDRNVTIYPYTQGDPEGYWESKSNLSKGLSLKAILESKGYNVGISRVTNTTSDDLGLSVIGELSNSFGADIFLSIHSNATGTGSRRNAPLMLFRGYDNQPVYPKSKEFATIMNRQLLKNEATVWTSTDINVRGDWDFYDWGTSGLGVLRQLTSPGALSEGSFHDYIPEAYRLMSDDFCWLEAWHFYKSFEEYFQIATTDTKGLVAGVVYDSRFLRNESYIMFGRDNNLPLTSAKITLLTKGGTKVQEYTTSTLPNGFYLFKEVEPGEYVVKVEADDHMPEEVALTVTADNVTYSNIPVKKVRNTPPAIVDYTPKSTDAQLCNIPVYFEFNWDMDTPSTEAAFSISPAVKGTFAWTDSNYKMTFTPSEPYTPNTTYTIKINKSAMHAGGTPMDQDFTFTFTTDARNYLTVMNCWPRQDVEMHTASPIVYFTCDAPLNSATATPNIKVKDSKGTVLGYSIRGVSYGKEKESFGWIKIPLSASLVEGETYTVSYSNLIADRNGIHLKDDIINTFTAKNLGVAKDGGEVVNMFDDNTLFSVNEEGLVNATAKLSKDASIKLFDAASLSVTYTFSDVNGKYEIKLPESQVHFAPSDALELSIYGDMTDNEVVLNLTSATGDIAIPVCKVDFFGWQTKKVNLGSYASLFTNTDGYTVKSITVNQSTTKQSANTIIKLDNLVKFANQGGVENIEAYSLTIGPNPASEYIIANGDAYINKLEMYNLNGQKIAEREGNVINVSEISNGTYIVKIYSQGITFTRKVIVLH